MFGCAARDLDICFAAAVLRLPFQSACTIRYSSVHRTDALYAHALSGSNLHIKIENALTDIFCFLVRHEGFEPPTFAFVVRDSIQLS